MPGLDPILLLQRACDRAGSQRQWALAHGMSPQYVTDVLGGRREPGPAILEALDLVRVVTYHRKPKTP